MIRRQELRELRLMQKEAHRAQAILNTKLETQREQMQRRFDQEMNVSDAIQQLCKKICHLGRLFFPETLS